MNQEPLVLIRPSLAENQELEAARDVWDWRLKTSRAAAMPGSVVIGRYSVLPYYDELQQDLEHVGSTLINTPAQHRWIADIGAWVPFVGPLTPRTWLASDITSGCVRLPPGRYVVKGATNSMKHRWSTHMFCECAEDVPVVCARIMQDSWIGSEQQLFVREYLPLRPVAGAPAQISGQQFTHEYRTFVLDHQIVATGFYWSTLDPEMWPLPDRSLLAAQERAIKLVGDQARFYVLDMGQLTTGEWVVIEINDGQQSGLSTIDPWFFYTGLKTRLGATL